MSATRGRADQAPGSMSKHRLDGFRMVNFLRAGGFCLFCSLFCAQHSSNADHGGAEQIFFGESVWELLQKPPYFQQHGWWGAGQEARGTVEAISLGNTH